MRAGEPVEVVVPFAEAKAFPEQLLEGAREASPEEAEAAEGAEDGWGPAELTPEEEVLWGLIEQMLRGLGAPEPVRERLEAYWQSPFSLRERELLVGVPLLVKLAFIGEAVWMWWQHVRATQVAGSAAEAVPQV